MAYYLEQLWFFLLVKYFILQTVGRYQINRFGSILNCYARKFSLKSDCFPEICIYLWNRPKQILKWCICKIEFHILILIRHMTTLNSLGLRCTVYIGRSYQLYSINQNVSRFHMAVVDKSVSVSQQETNMTKITESLGSTWYCFRIKCY